MILRSHMVRDNWYSVCDSDIRYQVIAFVLFMITIYIMHDKHIVQLSNFKNFSYVEMNERMTGYTKKV